MAEQPPEPPCPAGSRPHAERVAEIDNRLREGQTAAVGIDDTPVHIAWYKHEIGKYPRLAILSESKLGGGVHIIRVRKLTSAN